RCCAATTMSKMTIPQSRSRASTGTSSISSGFSSSPCSICGEGDAMNHTPNPVQTGTAPPTDAQAHAQAGGQHHPISVYFKVWGYLFVLSTMSYLVDYFHAEGALRWTLILTFMVLKAGLIVAIFMHMAWERMSLIYAILVPPLCLATLVLLMTLESDYTFW